MTVDAKMRFGADFTQADSAVDGFQRRVSAAVGGVQPRVEKLATAVSGVGSALGGVGSRAGAAFGAVSNLAAAFMTGGPLILGITAVTTAGAALYSHFEQAAKQAEELKKKSAEAAEELRKGLVAAAEALTKEIDDARERLTLFGIEGQERNVARVALRMGAGLVEGETLREERARLQREERRFLIESQGTSRAREAEREAAERSLAATRAALDVVQQKIEANRVEVAQLEQKFELENELLKLEQNRRRGRGRPRGGAAAADVVPDSLSFDVPDTQEFRLAQDATDVRLELERKAAAERQALADASLKEMVNALKEEADRKKAALAEEVRLKKAAEAEKLAAAKAAAAEEEAFRNRKAQESADFFLDVTSQAFTLSLDVLEAGLTGQTQGIAAMVATFVKGIGTQMVGIGLRQISEGAGFLIASGGTDPRGYGLVALGATVSAAGAAMAVTGTVAGAGLRNIQSSAGGGGGAGVRASSSAGRRAGSQRGESQGDGTVSITFMGGTFLDSPTDTARHLARTQMRARRTLFVPGGP